MLIQTNFVLSKLSVVGRNRKQRPYLYEENLGKVPTLSDFKMLDLRAIHFEFPVRAMRVNTPSKLTGLCHHGPRDRFARQQAWKNHQFRYTRLYPVRREIDMRTMLCANKRKS